jgi:hypothetical protein
MAATNSVLANDTSITLDWADVTSANLYHLQVGTKPDFSGSLIQNDSTLAVSTKAFTDTGADDAKRYWRWRYSTDAGATWSEWSEVGSYWLDTGASADVTLSTGQWALFDPDAVTDRYVLPDYPVYSVLDEQYNRAKERNRQGDMLTEWYASKAIISFMFEDTLYITHEHMRALKRFNCEVKTFFLATYKTNGVDSVPNIWKVVFSEDPQLTMMAPGRQDFFTGEVIFEEV